MDQQKLTDALFEADSQTRSRIAAQCPADWDMNRIFERSYRKYQAKRDGKPIPALPRRRDYDLTRSFVTAACLLIMIGGIGGVYALKNAAPKPQSNWTQPTATTASTASTTTTSTTTTATTTTAPQTLPVVLHSTRSETTTSTATQTVTQTTAETPASTQTAVQTAAPVTETVALPAISAEMPQTTTVMETAPPETTAEPVTEPIETGFTEDAQDKEMHRITFVAAQQYSHDEVNYTFTLDGWTMEDQGLVSGEQSAAHNFLVTSPEQKTYQLSHFTYAEFYFNYRTASLLCEDVTINGRSGKLCRSKEDIAPAQIFVLFWDDGGGITLMTGYEESPDPLIGIAEHFILN